MSESQSDSNESCEDESCMSQSHYNSDEHNSGASSIAFSDLLTKRRVRKNPQIRGKTWVFEGEITTDMLSADTDSAAHTPGLNDDDEDDDKAKFLILKSRLTSRLGDDFNIFLGVETVFTRFVIFCNLVSVLHPNPDRTNDPSKVKIQVRGFLQCRTTIAITKLRNVKSLPTVAVFITGKWERCNGELARNQLYKDCMRPANSGPWMTLHQTGNLGSRNNTRKKRRTTEVIFEIYLSTVIGSHFGSNQAGL